GDRVLDLLVGDVGGVVAELIEQRAELLDAHGHRVCGPSGCACGSGGMGAARLRRKTEPGALGAGLVVVSPFLDRARSPGEVACHGESRVGGGHGRMATMSHVSSMVITCPLIEEDPGGGLPALHAWCASREPRPV